ncbi:MAG TPA: glycosyltransferase family 4 protein [Gemmataceae bacterium]|jgi:UDP-glucose:(heptosyl)LPS alpha-1,3-glucosyltransferase
MNIAFCYESVLPYRGGCETYIASLARRLAADGHDVHLYARRWDASALPAALNIHRVVVPRVPRFLRPWVFGAACCKALASAPHQVSVGFDKISGLDVLYPQGGLYAATVEHNLLKYRSPLVRRLARLLKLIDPSHRSFLALDRHQYRRQPLLVVAISEMVRRHFEDYYQLDPANLRMVRIAIDLDRFDECDRPRRRLERRQQWGLSPEHIVGLFAAMNYRLKGLEPLLRAVARLPAAAPFRLLVAGNPRTASFERLARRLKIADRVRFAGYCADMRNCYFAADFFVHPTFYDPCSLVVLEALACGLPVVTSRHNGAAEVMRPPREGYVLDDPHNLDQLAGALKQLLDPARRAACAQAARRTAAQWTFEHHYRQMLAVFAEAAARKHAA